MAHDKINPVDWLTHLGAGLNVTAQLQRHARNLLVDRCVRAVVVTPQDSGHTCTALVRSKLSEKKYYQVRITFKRVDGHTELPAFACSCVMLAK